MKESTREKGIAVGMWKRNLEGEREDIVPEVNKNCSLQSTVTVCTWQLARRANGE